MGTRNPRSFVCNIQWLCLKYWSSVDDVKEVLCEVLTYNLRVYRRVEAREVVSCKGHRLSLQAVCTAVALIARRLPYATTPCFSL